MLCDKSETIDNESTNIILSEIIFSETFYLVVLPDGLLMDVANKILVLDNDKSKK